MRKLWKGGWEQFRICKKSETSSASLFVAIETSGMQKQSDHQISDEYLKKLWHDPSFFGSFRGVRTFQKLLKTDLNISVSQKRLLDILKQDSLFLIHQKKRPVLVRRKYDLNFYGQLVQLDLAFMFPDSETNDKYFLLAIDAYSFKIFAEPLQNKSTNIVLEAFKKIYKRFNHQIYEIQADRGTEFVSTSFRNFLKTKKTFIRFKQGKNKASFAEYGILLVKKKLYLMLRSELSHKWVQFLPQVIDSLNETPLKRLGWLRPNDITSEASSVFVDTAKKSHGIMTYHNPSYLIQRSNQANYDGDLKEGDYVYLDFHEKLFDMSFVVSVKYKMANMMI